MNPHDPYHAAGLWRNPFVVDEFLTVPEPLWIDRGHSTPPAPAGRRLIQIIGPPGAGKTSLIMHWRSRADGPYRHYPPTVARFAPPPVAAIAYWDEADRIPPLLRNRGLKRAARLPATVVAGTHVDLTGPARRYGFDVETIAPPPISPRELQAWAARRIRAVQFDPSAGASLILEEDAARDICGDVQHSWRLAADRLHVWAAGEVLAAAR